nr:TadE/TadG family type IV pilus assembly protein [uncultured Devosia sp.]
MGARAMHRFLSLARRFGRDERGVFAVLFGLMAIVLVALAGAVVDYVSLEQTRNRSQVALDAAALALQPLIFVKPLNTADIKSKAQALLRDRLGIVSGSGQFGVTAEVSDIQVNVDDGSLLLVAKMQMPTTFVSLVGVPTMSASIQSEATRKKLELEVVMVLDNSGSMQSSSRMTRLVDAAKCATYILMYDKVVDAPGNSNTCVPAAGAQLVEDVRIGIVPFTMFVNVGAGNAGASWMDTGGASVIANDNFDNDDDEDVAPTVALPTRSALFTATGEAWRGCVEARPHIKSGTLTTEYLDTDDTTPLAGNTKFVPLFSPDMPSAVGGNNYIDDSPAICDRPSNGNPRCDFVERRTSSWSGWSTPTVISSTITGGSTNFTSNTLYPNAFYGNRPPGCTCRSATYSSWSGNSSVQTRNGTCTGSYVPIGLSDRELQERVCKYYQGTSGSTFSSGPNADCTRTPILPLTATPATVISTINNMQAEGGTNIHMGAVWGMRVLSPTEPFTQGGAYDEAISKVMIIMTDGENTAYQTNNGNGSAYNSAYGFPYNSQNTNANSTSGGNVTRLGPVTATNAQLVTQMNDRTAQTCANAKAAGITVYTIGLATSTVTQSTPAVVQALLTNCATTADRARFPEASSELKTTFEAIANDLSALRLAQ